MKNQRTTRRDFLKTGAVGATGGGVSTLIGSGPVSQALASPGIIDRDRRPNILYIIADQLGLDAIGAHGRRDVRTPNMDRLISTGTTFMESHSTSSVCSPARSSLMTGRMPQETGVIGNGLAIHPDCPTVGHVLGSQGYDTYYCGKWHTPGPVPGPSDGFTVLPARGGQGDIDDTAISRSVEGLIHSLGRSTSSSSASNAQQSKKPPWLTVASFLQPHDICFWGNHAAGRLTPELPFAELADRLPELPPNLRAFPEAPNCLELAPKRDRSDLQWRYYLYTYARMIEMLDADIGRLLDALDRSGQADDTVVVFTSDHGDGQGRHSMVSKWYPYEEAVKVPLTFTCPGRLPSGVRDETNLVNGCDIMPTLCDLAGVKPPERTQGVNLTPILQQRADARGHEFVVSEFRSSGMMVRTDRYKYTMVPNDPVEQLFDMKDDPWEMVNICHDRPELMAQHRELLAGYRETIIPRTSPTPVNPNKPPKSSVKLPATRSPAARKPPAARPTPKPSPQK